MTGTGSASSWGVRGSYFEACNCDAICPCRSVSGQPGGASTYGECFGALSWHVLEGHHDELDLSNLRIVMTLRYRDDVEPSTRWEVVLYVDENADEDQRIALADIFLGRAGGTALAQYAGAIGTVLAVRPARISLEHVEARKRIDIVGYLSVSARDPASDIGVVRCGIPGYDHPGTELYGEDLRAEDPAMRFEVRGRRHAAFTTDFNYSSS